jgi:acetyl esterase/lipase
MAVATRDGAGNLMLPARTIPVPKSISERAQQALMTPRLELKWPTGKDKSVWRSFVKECDARIASMFEALPPFPGRIESRRLGPTTIFELVPDSIPVEKRDRAILYVHGGGWVMAGGELAFKAVQMFTAQIQTTVYAVDYRMPPDHLYPAALDDVVLAYRDLLLRHHPNKIVMMGSSAGAGLVAASILKLRDMGLPLPAAAVLHTPGVDMTESGDTFETLKDIDIVLPDRATDAILLFTNGHDLRDPYVSPLFGDFSRGFPPTMLISGTRDILLSSTVQFHRALRKAGIQAELHVFEAMPHGGFGGAPEDAELVQEEMRFIDRVLADK